MWVVPTSCTHTLSAPTKKLFSSSWCVFLNSRRFVSLLINTSWLWGSYLVWKLTNDINWRINRWVIQMYRWTRLNEEVELRSSERPQGWVKICLRFLQNTNLWRIENFGLKPESCWIFNLSGKPRSYIYLVSKWCCLVKNSCCARVPQTWAN